MAGQLLGDNLIKGNRDDRSIESFHFEVEFVGYMREIDFAAMGVNQLDLLTLLELDTRLAERRRDLDGGS